ncbi:hypothetical protein JCM18899A_31890 [Nocardioides sp. AN3]
MASTSQPYDTSSTRGLVALGVTSFAGVMLSTVAIFQILEGIAALAKDEVYVTGINYSYKFDVTSWGWIHLIIGIIALATGIAILFGQTWGRLLGIFIAILGTLSNFAFIPYYPVWSIVVIGFWILTLWALCTQLQDD